MYDRNCSKTTFYSVLVIVIRLYDSADTILHETADVFRVGRIDASCQSILSHIHQLVIKILTDLACSDRL